MASLGTNIDTVTNCVLVEGDVASIQYIRHFSAQEVAHGRGPVIHGIDDGSFEQHVFVLPGTEERITKALREWHEKNTFKKDCTNRELNALRYEQDGEEEGEEEED